MATVGRPHLEPPGSKSCDQVLGVRGSEAFNNGIGSIKQGFLAKRHVCLRPDGEHVQVKCSISSVAS
jgi:hypothetical protein